MAQEKARIAPRAKSLNDCASSAVVYIHSKTYQT